MIKKNKEKKIVKKYLRWINLYIVFKDKCNKDVKSENSTGNNKQGIPYIAGPKQEGKPFSGMIKLTFLKVRSINQ